MKQADTTVLLLSGPVLLTMWWYQGLRPPGAIEGFARCLWPFLSFFALLGVIPVIYVTARLRHCEFGSGLGDVRFGWKFLLLIPIVVAPAAALFSRMPGISEQYPMCRLLADNRGSIFWNELVYVAFYYTAWEFYFRGFLLFGLKDSLGPVNAVMIQTISSCLVHLGKPEAEALAAIPFGVALGYLALRTGSFWYGFAIHASLGVLLDLFILAWR